MKRPVAIFIALSIALNFWVGRALVSRAKSAPSRPPAPNRQIPELRTSGRDMPVPNAETTVDWALLTPATTTGNSRVADPRVAKAKLEMEDFPDRVIDGVMLTVISEEHGYFEAEAAMAKMPAAESYPKLDALFAEFEPERRELMPEYFARFDEGIQRARTARYGDMPPEIAARVHELESESDKNQRDAMMRSIKSDAHPVGVAPHETDKTFVEQLKPILDDVQMADYLRYNTLLARGVQAMVSSIDIDESTYSGLLDAAIAREGSAAPDVNPNDVAARNYAPSAVEATRQVLGDDRFVQILDRIDQRAASVDGVYQVAGLSASARADLFMETIKLRYQFYTDGQSGVPHTREDMAAEVSSLKESLIRKAGLSPEQIAGFDRTLMGSDMARGVLNGGNGRSAPGRATQ